MTYNFWPILCIFEIDVNMNLQEHALPDRITLKYLLGILTNTVLVPLVLLVAFLTQIAPGCPWTID